MRIPVVLPVVNVVIDESGVLTVDVDGEPYDAGQPQARGDLQALLDEITGQRDTAVRVELQESDGTTYADIATPPSEAPEPSIEPPVTLAPSAPGISGTGFRPGEPVAVAYVLLRETADATGRTVIHLPSAALAGRHAALVLLGLDSKVATLVEAAT